MYKTMKELERLQKACKAEEAPCRGRPARASRGRPVHDSARGNESESGTGTFLTERRHQKGASPRGNRDEVAIGRHNSDSAKRTQFAPALMGVLPCPGKAYDDKPPAGEPENKAKQSHISAPGRQFECRNGESGGVRTNGQ